MEPTLDYIYDKTECRKCKRPMIIERWLCGVLHTIEMMVTCAECLNDQPSAEFEKDHPEAAKDIFEWKNEVTKSKS